MSEQDQELTQREVEVLRLACRGLSNRGIAARLQISPRTVGHHLAHVFDKTGLRTRSAVAVWAVVNGILPDAGPDLVPGPRPIGRSTDAAGPDRS